VVVVVPTAAAAVVTVVVAVAVAVNPHQPPRVLLPRIREGRVAPQLAKHVVGRPLMIVMLVIILSI